MNEHIANAERGLNPFAGIGDKIEEIKAEVARRVRVAIAVETIDTALSRPKDLDPNNAALYADLQAELAARK